MTPTPPDPTRPTGEPTPPNPANGTRGTTTPAPTSTTDGNGHPQATDEPTPPDTANATDPSRATATPALSGTGNGTGHPRNTAMPAPSGTTTDAGPARPGTDHGTDGTHPGGPGGSGGAGHPTTPPGQGTGTTSTALTRAQLWTRARGFLLAVAVLLTAAVALAGLRAGDHHGRLDPRSADPDGSRALAQLLKERGVTTRVVTNAQEAAAAAGPGTTLLVADPDLLGEPQRRAIRSAIDLSGGRTVLVAPGSPTLPELAPAAHAKGFAHQRDLDPGTPACTLPAAGTAGRAGTGDGLRYTTDLPGATGCYPSGGHPTLLVLPSTTKGGDTVLLGSETFLLNKRLADEGNASLALQLLGSRPELVWYLPTPADMSADPGTGAQDPALLDLVPSGWTWALLQLFVAAALAALWRARRLGPLVTEDLPVAIRASEATEGHARLYRRADARDRAATVLRAAARERLAPLVGVPAPQAHDPAALVPAVSARLTAGGRPSDPAALLFGTTPADDAALVALADHLDALEREVRSP
ncbi:hypothetical protein Slala05_40060 [Streptomyces lavendulae subsp. lavendulae]|nr:hypothetical protein Slala05_40060 [Streptomyces lavendulae subsp. lavendulae]